MGKFLRKFAQRSILIFIFSLSALAETIVYVDVDDTLFESRATYDGTFNPPLILFRIDKINPIQKMPTGLETITVTFQEMKRMREGLAKYSNGKFIPGSLKKITLASGEKVTIGEYAFIEEKSQIYLRASPKGRNYLLETFQAAESADPTGRWQGPAWGVMIQMLNDKDKAGRFGLLTARGHTREEWGEFFSYLKEKGYIQYLPNLSHIHNLSLPEYQTYGRSISERKANLLAQLALHGLGRTVLTDADIHVDRNGEGVEKSHVLIYADNSQENLKEISEALEKITTGRMTLKNIKFILVNAGYEKDVQESQRPRMYVLRSDDGQPRRLTREESERELSILTSFNFNRSKASQQKTKRLTCEGLFQ